MSIFEYDEEEHMRQEREESRQEGFEEGEERINDLYDKLHELNREEDIWKAIKMLNTERNCWKNFILIKNFTRPDAVLLSSIWFFFTFAIYHGHECAYSGRQYAGADGWQQD